MVPAAPVQVIVYLVVVRGVRDTEPEAATAPMLWSMLKEIEQFAEVHDNVTAVA